MSVQSVTERWAEYFPSVPYAALPDDVVDLAKRAMLDLLGVAIAGSSMPMATICADYFAGLGGRAEASVLCRTERLPAIHAATINGVLGHALDMDDGHRAASGHPGVATFPAALAAAELAGASGRELLRASVFGYEVFVRLAAAINPAHLRRGFHTTATVGPFAAATASGLLIGLDGERLVRALGLAGLQGAGLMEVFHDGAMAKPFQVARASAAGLLAAELARRGAAGPRMIVEGHQGFLHAMSGGDRASNGEAAPKSLVDGLGRDWAIRGVYIKEHAACRHTHAAIDGAATLRREHGIVPEQVASAVVRTYAVADRLCGRAELPSGPSEAKFSFPFTVALGLTFGHARASCFTPEMVADQRLRALASRVSVVVDPDLDRRYPEQRPSILEVTTRGGQSVRIETPIARGEPELPLTRDGLEAKFLDNARSAIPEQRAVAILEHVRAIETQESCVPLMDLLAGRGAGRAST